MNSSTQEKLMLGVGALLVVAGIGVGVAVYLAGKKGIDCKDGVTGKKMCLKVGGRFVSISQPSATDPNKASLTALARKDGSAYWKFYEHPSVPNELCLNNAAKPTMYVTIGPGGDPLMTTKPTFDKVDTWEGMTVECLGDNRAAIKSSFGGYMGLNAEKTGFVATAKTVGENETFEFVKA